MARKRTIETLRRRYGELKDDRRSWEPTHRAIQEHILPRRGRFLTTEANQGDRRGTRMIDSTALIACERGSSGIHSGLSSQSQQWVRDDLEGFDEVPTDARAWLDAVTAAKMQIWESGGLYPVLKQLYHEAMGFGTAAWTASASYEHVIEFMARTCGEYWLACDYKGRHVEMIVADMLFADQIMDEFELTTETAPPAVAEAIRNDSPRQRFEVVEYRAENDRAIEQPKHTKDAPFVEDIFVVVGGSNDVKTNDERNFLRRSPSAWRNFGAMRWEDMGRDPYGRGPGMDALGDSAGLQSMRRDYLRAIEYQARPPLQGPAWSNDRQADYRPGGYTPREKAHQDNTITTLFDVRLDLSHLSAEIAATQGRIREVFYNDVLATFLMDRRGKTATETDEMAAEKLTLFAPVAGRFVDDLLIPINDSTFGRMVETGFFDEGGTVGPRPESIKGAQMKLEFLGVLAQAAKGVLFGKLKQLVFFAADLAEAKKDPSILHRIDDDATLDEARDLIGAPAKITRSRKDAQELRDRDAAQQKAVQEAAAAREAAAAAKDASQAVVGQEAGRPVGALEAAVKGAA